MMGQLVGATLAGLSVAVVVLAAPTGVAGTATMSPAVCSPYEAAVLAASIHNGNYVRLACTIGRDV